MVGVRTWDPIGTCAGRCHVTFQGVTAHTEFTRPLQERHAEIRNGVLREDVSFRRKPHQNQNTVSMVTARDDLTAVRAVLSGCWISLVDAMTLSTLSDAVKPVPNFTLEFKDANMETNSWIVTKDSVAVPLTHVTVAARADWLRLLSSDL